MNPMKLDVAVDEMLARALPALRPLVGKRVELIVLETSTVPERTKFEDFVPFEPPEGVGPVSLEDMERAIAKGATKRAGS